MSKAPRTMHDDGDAIDRYVAVTFDRFRRTLVTQIPTFDEPRVADPARALKRLHFLIETLAGFAIGSAIGAVASAARRGFGDEVRAGVGRVLGRALAAGTPPAVVTEMMAPVPFLRDPTRPLLDALGSQLHARLCIAVKDARAHISRIHAEITREAPDRLPVFAELLDRLAADDTSALAFTDQLAAGWRLYAASLSEHPLDVLAADARDMWRNWTSHLSGPIPAPEPTQDQVVAQGFLMRIA